MGFKDNIRKLIRNFLQLKPAYDYQLEVQETLNFEDNVFKNRVWYRGDAYELSQLYNQMPNHTLSFWGSSSTYGNEIQKRHTGLPNLIVSTLSNIVVADMNDFAFKDLAKTEVWKDIADDNGFDKLVKKATNKVLALGDGAFVVSYNPQLSDYPILEFFGADSCDFKQEYGRVKEVIVYRRYRKKEKKYILHERRGYGFVKYELYKDDMQVPMTELEETKDLVDVAFDDAVMLAVPYIIWESDSFECRGKSVFDGKCDNFDSLDEAWSQWMDALRSGRTKTYIPDCLIPRDAGTGAMLKPNAFDNRFIKTGSDVSETAKNQITSVSPTIPTDDYLNTYVTALDLCLQGLISPSTLGIDVKKLDNAEAQREKEKTTLYTRNTIVDVLTEVLQKLVDVVFKSMSIQAEVPLEDTECNVNFGEYANPSFEALVETLSNPNTPMSIEAKVEEMWGDSKDNEWKQKEVERIKEQVGIMTVPEPALNLE